MEHETIEILGGAARLHHFGTAAGDFQPAHEGAVARMAEVRRQLELEALVWLRVNFTDRVADARQLVPAAVGVLSTADLADGYLLDTPRVGVAIASGDCATGVMFPPGGRHAIVMHLGLANVHPPGGGYTVMERAMATFRRWPPNHLRFWNGAAIGPCCYGYPDRTDAERAVLDGLREAWGEDVCPGRVRQGPRKGFVAVDHVLIGQRRAAKIGIHVRESEGRCIACRGLDDPDEEGFGRYYSHTRDAAGERKRNLVVVTL